MALASPLNPLHQQAEASFFTYGHPTGPSAQVVETFGELEGEYAALRKGCILLDLPQRGNLRITGKDRLDFLNRMVTQELKGLRPLQARRAFWLNRKGRIDADLRLIELPEEMFIDVDVLAAAPAAASLAEFVFSEQVEIRDESDAMHRLALHGPTAIDLLAAASEPMAGPPLSELQQDQAAVVRVAGRRVIVDRWDWTGEPGLELLMQMGDVNAVYEQLLERGLNGNGPGNPSAYRMRPAGWHAANIARIEAGTPLYNIDFGPDSLPAETGVLNDRVSFTKGCYLGQEVVARMHSLGHPKQVLTAIRLSPTEEQRASGSECQPDAGAPIIRETNPSPVGAVTSSTRSPMLGDEIIAFAAVRWGAHEPGTLLSVRTIAGDIPAAVQPTLRFWPRER